MKDHPSRKPFYLVLFLLYYVLQLYSQNIYEVEPYVIVRPILVLLFVSGLLFGIFRLITKKVHKAFFLSFFTFFLLITYGLFYGFLKDHAVLGINFGRHIVLGPIWFILFGSILILVLRKETRISNSFVGNLNFITAILLLFTIGSIIIKLPKIDSISSTGQDSSAAIMGQEEWLADFLKPLDLPEGQQLPDIYYIIPDMFARNDAILKETDYDNTQFLTQLRDTGFYVADCSRSNYASTQLSIASSLNINYLEDIQGGMTNRQMLVTPMNDSLIRKSLERLGYQTIVFDNGFGLPEIQNAFITIKPDNVFFLFQHNNPFENLIVKNSILRIFYDVNLGQLSSLFDKLFFPYWQHIEAQKNIFDQLPTVPDLDGPKFVFVHIMMPHPPYLIHEDGQVETNSDYYREALGQPINEELYLKGYLMQVKYVQNRLLETVRQIIDGSDPEPVIIIQGDHGIRYENRLDILNAYYVPQTVADMLYPGITPVNSFRVILNGVFGTDYELLPDVSWYSEYPDWFNMEIEPEQNPACVQTP